MKKIPLILVFCILSLNAFTQNSSSFRNPLVWLRADNPGANQNQWQDISGHGYNAAVQNNLILPDTALFNYNKCFYFDSSSLPLITNYYAKKDAKMLVFAVYKPEYELEEKGIWSLGLDSSIQVKLTTQRLKNVYKFIKYGDSTSTVPTINLLSQNWKNKHIDSTISRLSIAGTDSLNFTGKFAEFILYDTSLSGNDIYKLHTYLAVKYGVSIQDMDYMNSSDSIIWNYKKNILYKNDIAAIGKDSTLFINQKQSAGNGGDAPLKIASEKLHKTNLENPNVLNENDYLIWGNNGEFLTEVNQDTIDTTVVSNMSKCVWMMKRTGATAGDVSTQVVLNASQIYGIDSISLVINRYGNALFPIDSSIIVSPDSIDYDMNYYFTGIQWDIDNSGSDVFGFQINKSITANLRTNENTSSSSSNASSSSEQTLTSDSNSSIIDCSMYPNPTVSQYTLHLKLKELLPVTITIQDTHGKKLDLIKRSGYLEYTINGYIKDPGIYFVVVDCGNDSKTYKLVVQ